MKNHLSFIGLLWILLISACHCTHGKVQSEEDKMLYTIGQMYARRVDYLKMNEKELDILLQGIKDWTLHKHSQVDFEATRPLVQNFIDQRLKEGVDLEKRRGTAYMELFLKNDGLKTASGLGYKILKAGSDVKASSHDSVQIHYKGMLVDGHVFQSSEGQTEGALFPLQMVIDGWQEGLQLIGEGGEIQLVVPAELAYGDAGSTPEIPGGATLIFDIQLQKVIKGKVQ